MCRNIIAVRLWSRELCKNRNYNEEGELIMKKIVKVIAGISCIGAVIGGIMLFVESKCRNN